MLSHCQMEDWKNGRKPMIKIEDWRNGRKPMLEIEDWRNEKKPVIKMEDWRNEKKPVIKMEDWINGWKCRTKANKWQYGKMEAVLRMPDSIMTYSRFLSQGLHLLICFSQTERILFGVSTRILST